MAIKIIFSGVMLFVFDDDELSRVIIPHAGPGAIPREGVKGKHVDERRARVHHPGIIWYDENDKFVDRVEPMRHKVDIGDAADGPTSVGNLSGLPGLDRVNNDPMNPKPNDLELDPAADASRIGASITLYGGKLGEETPTDAKWSVDGSCNPNHPWITPAEMTLTTVWESSASSVMITMPGKTITLEDGWTAYIYNSDSANPLKEDLTKQENCKGTVLDDDYRWLYQLVRPKQGKLKDRVNPPAVLLPAPRADCVQHAPDVSTCLGGGWGGGGG